MMPNKDTANNFLDFISSGFEPGETKFLITLFPPGMDAYPINTFEYTPDFYVKDDMQYYFTPNPRKELPIKDNGKASQGGKKSVEYANCLFADIDYGDDGHKKDSFYQTKEDVLTALREFKLKPSVIYHTGHGFQALYLFEEALKVGEQISIQEYETLNRRLQEELKADTTPSISHILRLPGSLNLKTEPVPVEIIEVNNDVLYTLDEFKQALPQTQKPSSIADRMKERKVQEETLSMEKIKVDKRKLKNPVKSLVMELKDPSDPNNTDRSRLLFKAVYGMCKLEFTPSQIYSFLTLDGSEMSKYLLMKRSSEQEIKADISRCILKSREYIAENIRKTMDKVEIIGHNINHDILYRKNGNILAMPITKLNIDTIHIMTGDRPEGEFELETIKKKLITACTEQGLVFEDKVMKEGIWWKNGEFLLISKGNALLLSKKGQFTEYKKPIYQNNIVDLKSSSNWYDKDHMIAVYEDIKLSDVFDSIYLICDQFNWKHEESAEYMTALLMLSPFQNASDWNPFVYLSGASGTGKSTFLQDFFSNLYPGLLNHLGKSTAHAIAQEIGNTGRIPLLDEFEKNKHIPEILELAKIANRGGHKTSGTPGINSLRYRLKHIFWFASIYVSLQDEAQKNRSFIFELDRVIKTEEFSLPSQKELKRIGTESIAAVLKYWNKIEARSQTIKNRYPELDARMKDTLKYSIAVLELVEEERTGKEVVKEPPVFAYVSPEREEEKILDDIMASDIWVHTDSTTKTTVFDALMNYTVSKYSLNDVGLAKIKVDGKFYLAIHPPVVTRKLLNDLREYEYNNIAEPLGRFEGAQKSHPSKIGKKTQKCTTLPWEIILDRYQVDENNLESRKKPLYKKKTEINL
ncbi:MAG TPA: hypothetical protein PLV00_06790 [Caldisericia bacterium]|nr:hypothetical protein [Caldisericia bacterium]